MQHGKVTVERNADEHVGRQVEAEGAQEQEEFAERFAGHPLGGEAPSDLQRHHDEGDDQVRGGQVRDHERDARLAVATTTDQRHEDGEIARRGHHEEGAVHADHGQRRVREARHGARRRGVVAQHGRATAASD